MAFDVDDSKSVLAIYMLTSGAGFFIPLIATRNMRVTDADATLSLYGGTRGIVHGLFAWGYVRGKEADAREALTFGMLGSASEAITFFYLADRSNMTPGTAEVICFGGDLGLGMGIGTAYLADFFKEDKERLASASILFGSGCGLLTGKFLADNQPYTRGDAFVLRGTVILGAYVPLAVVDMTEPKENKAYTAAAMGGSVIGAGIGHLLVKGKDFTTGQGTLINLGELAGGLVGLGVAYLISSEKDNSSLYLTSSSLGALGGFWLLYKSFAKSARNYEKSSSWNFNFAPEGLVSYAIEKKYGKCREQIFPFAKLEYRF